MPTSRKNFELFALPEGLAGPPELLAPATYGDLGALELQHIERWIRERPDLVGEDLKIVTNQFAKFEGAKDRLDVLALDRNGRNITFRARVHFANECKKE